MNCPVCGKKMEKGVFDAYCSGTGTKCNKLIWVPDSFFKKHLTMTMHFSKTIKKDGGIIKRMHENIFDDNEGISYCCKDCGKLVIDVK